MAFPFRDCDSSKQAHSLVVAVTLASTLAFATTARAQPTPVRDSASARPGERAQNQDPATPTAIVAAKRWALVVGASRYEHLGRLQYAARDAHEFAAALTEDLGFDAENVRLLSDAQDDGRLTPTTGHILGELEALLADPRRNPTDLFVFFFCGHGTGRGGRGDRLLPTDARPETIDRVGLPVREILDRLRAADMRNVLMIVDACRQGVDGDFGTELRDLADDSRLALALACKPGAQSYEDRYFGHGVFTHFLLEALRDPAERSEIAGALWAADCLQRVANRVREHTADRAAPQEPMVWSDPTRDVLLDLRTPAAIRGSADAVLEEVTTTARRLATPERITALTTTALELFSQGSFAQVIELMKAVEQLAPLEPFPALLLGSSLLHSGRQVEAARVFRELRQRAPDSLAALQATVCDSSGAVAPVDAAAAARAIWDGGLAVPFGLLLRMVDAMLLGGSSQEALEMARNAVTQAPSGSREAEFLTGIVAILEQRVDAALLAFERARATPGTYPSDEQLLRKQIEILDTAGRTESAARLLDEAIETNPRSATLHAARAWFRHRHATDTNSRAATLDAVRTALARDLSGSDLLLVVRAAGSAAPRFAAEIRAVASLEPFDWQAQLALAFADQGEDLKARVAAAAKLAPREAPVLAMMGRLTLDATLERIADLREQFQDDDTAVAQLDEQEQLAIRSIHERIAPLATDLGTDDVGWALLAETSRRMLAHEAFHRLAEAHLGARIDAGTLPESLVLLLSESCVATGRIERFDSLGSSLLRERPEREARLLLRAMWHATEGSDDRARALLEGQPAAPRLRNYRNLSTALHALLAARQGRTEHARSLLEPGDGRTAPPPTSPPPTALAGLAWHALGESERAASCFEGLHPLDPANSMPAFLALWRALRDDGTCSRGQLAALYQPGNPLLSSFSYHEPATLDAFVGTHVLRVGLASGPVPAAGGQLTLSILPGGRVIGVLEPGGAEQTEPERAGSEEPGAVVAAPWVVRGQMDRFGNLEGEIAQAGKTFTLLAKWAPPTAWQDCPLLQQTGQIVQILGTGNVQFAWSARPEG